MFKVRGSGWAYAGFWLNGLVVVMLGPLLPRLQALWGLGDAQGGALLAAQFLGMSLGTIFVRRDRRSALAVGSFWACLGLGGAAVLVAGARNASWILPVAFLAYLGCGFGLGQIITALNLGWGAALEGRSSRLEFGNAMWSVGAICGPVVVALALALSGGVGRLAVWLGALAVLLPVVWFLLDGREGVFDESTGSNSDLSGAALGTVVLFAALMFLYGSAEASVSGWVTTFARRAGGVGAAVSPLSTSAFWFGVASGRALAGGLMKGWRERNGLLLLLGAALAASLGLVFAQGMGQISGIAVVAGMALGPTFAFILSGALGAKATPRQTGLVLAMCGAGATVMPFLLGVVSERTSSLREALVLPGVCLAGMLVLAAVGMRSSQGDADGI
jgi:fucose permease